MAGWVLAVDFGTSTTSAAAGTADGRVEVVELGGAARMPSVVLATESGELIVGAAAEAQLALAPERAERTPKRRLGDEVMLLGSRAVRPVEAVAAILEAVATEAIRRQGGVAPSELRLTHPARWGSLRRAALAEAAGLAGLPKPVFVPEPVAAAVHFADERIVPGAFVAVYDLGGGTFDTAVLRRLADGFELVGLPGGDERLGGELFDDKLFDQVGQRIAAADPDAWESLRFSTERSWRKAGYDLRLEVRRAKEALSANAEYTIYVGAPVDATVVVTRDELEGLIAPDVASTVSELEATVTRAGLALTDLAAVNLVGGSSRIPLVTRLVAERFGQVPQTWGDPKAAVALGAIKATRLTTLSSGSGGASLSGSIGTPKVAAAAPLPERVGDYTVVAELGRGGMGVVYLAQQASLARPVAVKTIPMLDPGLTDRLEREASVLAELQHPNIATVIDVGTDERGTFVVMPYFPGGTATHLLDRDGRVMPGVAVSILAGVADALAATHARGFLHRDVKPSNILLSEGGDPYLADFGLALPMLDSSRLTNSRSVLGTVPYTAPEILSDESPSPASDTYALAITAYQLLTGHLPFAGSNVLAVLDQIRQADPTPIADHVPDCPPALAALVHQGLDSDPSRRPTDLRAWANELRAAAMPEPVVPNPPATWAIAASHLAANVAAGAPVEEPAPTTPPAEPPAGSAEPEPELAALTALPVVREGTHGGANTHQRVLVLAAIAVVILLIGGVVALTGSDDDGKTGGPNVVAGDDSDDNELLLVPIGYVGRKGKNETKKELEAKGFTNVVLEGQSSNTVKANFVISITPEPRSKVDPDTKITITYSLGPRMIQIPQGWEGKFTKEEVEASLKKRGFTKIVIAPEGEYHPTIENNRLIALDPEPGTAVSATTPITIRWSKGKAPEVVTTDDTTVDPGDGGDGGDGGDDPPKPPPTVNVASVANLSESAARTKLQQQGLVVTVVRQYSPKPAGTATGTSPSAGSPVKAGTTVKLFVSKGPSPNPIVNPVATDDLNYVLDASNYYSGCYCWALRVFLNDTDGRGGKTFYIDDYPSVSNAGRADLLHGECYTAGQYCIFVYPHNAGAYSDGFTYSITNDDGGVDSAYVSLSWNL